MRVDFENINNNLEIGIWSFDVQKNFFLLSPPGIEKVTGYTLTELRASYLSIIHPEDKERFIEDQRKVLEGVSLNENYRFSHKNGEIKWVKIYIFPVFDSNRTIFRLDGIFADITENKKTEEMSKYFAYHDYLTNLPNRRLFVGKVKTLIDSLAPNKNSLALLCMDLDHFKNINCTFGNNIGDKLLKLFSHRISKLLDNVSLLARLGSNEFGLIIWSYLEADYPIELAKKIIEKLKEPFFIDQYEIYISISIGISTFATDGDTTENLIRNSEAALYHAKVNGKNSFQIYSSSLSLNSDKQFSLERDLRKAIKNNQFLVYFQPRVDTKTGKMASAEALIRWEHPDWGLISPQEFIPLAEENGFIIEIEDWVLKQVCHYIKEWENNASSIVPISINKSARVILQNDWATNVFSVIKETDIVPSFLEFEITETALLQTNETIKSAFALLQEVGIRIALDDFGTGYSSLSHLKEYPINTIKIDKTFVQNISNQRDNMIIKSIISLAKGLKIRVVAEGVETFEQLTFLKQQSCDEVQGYWFCKPLPKVEFEKLLLKGILEPTELINYSTVTNNKRKYFRINLKYPLSSQMSIITISGQKVKLGKTEVLIEDISAGGIKFLSTLELPVRPDLILQFKSEIMYKEAVLLGRIVWKKALKDIFQYGVEFAIDENSRDKIMKLLNRFSIQLRKNPLVPGCKFVLEDRINYLKKICR